MRSCIFVVLASNTLYHSVWGMCGQRYDPKKYKFFFLSGFITIIGTSLFAFSAYFSLQVDCQCWCLSYFSWSTLFRHDFCGVLKTCLTTNRSEVPVHYQCAYNMMWLYWVAVFLLSQVGQERWSVDGCGACAKLHAQTSFNLFLTYL